MVQEPVTISKAFSITLAILGAVILLFLALLSWIGTGVIEDVKDLGDQVSKLENRITDNTKAIDYVSGKLSTDIKKTVDIFIKREVSSLEKSLDHRIIEAMTKGTTHQDVVPMRGRPKTPAYKARAPQDQPPAYKAKAPPPGHDISPASKLPQFKPADPKFINPDDPGKSKLDKLKVK